MFGRRRFSRFLKIFLSVIGLGFLAGHFLTRRYTEGESDGSHRGELAKRIRDLADRVENPEREGAEPDKGDA